MYQFAFVCEIFLKIIHEGYFQIITMSFWPLSEIKWTNEGLGFLQRSNVEEKKVEIRVCCRENERFVFIICFIYVAMVHLVLLPIGSHI